MAQHTKQSAISNALINFDLLPDSAGVRLPVVVGLYASSPASVWRWAKSGKIPKPQKMSERITVWNVGELRTSLSSKAGGVKC
jgi:predicted DNA-binding transcriptional regulator AlpA